MSTPASGSGRGIAFIVGDPKSRKNITRIRKHAGQAAARSQGEASDAVQSSSAAVRSTPTKRPLQPSTTKAVTSPNVLAQGDRPSSTHCDGAWSEAMATDGPGHETPTTSADDVTTQSSPRGSVVGQDRAQEDPRTQQSAVQAEPTGSGLFRFSTTGTNLVGTWWGNESDSEQSHLHSAALKQLRTPKLVQQTQQSRKSAIVGRRKGDPFLTYDDMVQDHNARSLLSRQAAATPQLGRPRMVKKTTRQQPEDALVRAHTRQAQWRSGAAPAKPLTLSVETSVFDSSLQQFTVIYSENFDGIWRAQQQNDHMMFETSDDCVLLYEALETTNALLESGKRRQALGMIEFLRVALHNAFSSNHPQLYNWLAISAVFHRPAETGDVRSVFASYAANEASSFLGDHHPATALFDVKLDQASRTRLILAMIRRVRDMSQETFGPDCFQTIAFSYFLARTLSRLQMLQESLEVFRLVIDQLEAKFGVNSLPTTYCLIDKATAFIAANQPEIRGVLYASDALRRLDILDRSLDYIPLTDPDTTSEVRKMIAINVACAKIAALRTLGTLNVMQKNYGAAIASYRQALNLGVSRLGPDAAPTQLAQTDFEEAQVLELSRSVDVMSVAERPADPSSLAGSHKGQFSVLNTTIGTVVSKRTTFPLPTHQKIPTMINIYNVPTAPDDNLLGTP